MIVFGKLSLVLVSVLVLASSPVKGQDTGSRGNDGLAVFLDCNARNCDYDHARREIEWVHWVRDREYADVHLLITSQRTGGNGSRYQLDYLGRGSRAGFEKTLEYTSSGEDTDTEVRNQLVRTMAVGLVEFVENSSVSRFLHVSFDAPGEAAVQAAPRDPWNLWVFRISGDLSLEGEAQENGREIQGSFSADRVSESFKINVDLRGEYTRDRFDLEDEETVVSTAEDLSADLLSVWSLSDHWSAGLRVNAGRSTRFNSDMSVSGGPAIEYNIFPYQESTRRQLTFRYVVEPVSFDYASKTVESKTGELLARHSLIVTSAVQQPWGEIFGLVEAIQYLGDLSTHRVSTYINLEYRLFRGLNLDIRGNLARIKDQFYLSIEDLTEEEILLRRKQRETDYEFDIRIGISYQFGSRLANVVNPRMGGGRRFFF